MKSPLYVVAFLVLASAFASFSPPVAAQDATTYAVSGVVVSDQGEPIAGAAVHGYVYQPAGSDVEKASRPYYDGGQASDTTDAEGRFTLQLPAGRGSLSVWYEKWGASASQEVEVSGDVSDLRFVLATPPPRTAVVEGRVVDASGNPVSGATVRLDQGCCYAYPAELREEPATPPAEGDGNASTAGSAGMAAEDARMIMPAPCCYDRTQEVVTGADGAFRFESYGGPRMLTAWAKGYAQTTKQLDAKENETVRAELTLEKVPAADAVVKGRIVDAVTGLPVKGAHVSLQNVEWSRYGWAEGGDAGTFELTTIPGWAQVRVDVWDRGYAVPVADDGVASDSLVKPSERGYYSWVRTLRLQSGANDLVIELDPKPLPDVVLTGYVLDPEAKAGVPGATISFWNQDTGEWGSATTDATGSYRILVRAGHFQVSGWAQGHLGSAESLVIAQGESAKRYDLPLPKGDPKHAPCHDADCGGPIMYAEGDAKGVAARREASYGPTPTAAPAASSGTSGMTTGSQESADGTRAQSYAGGGGGLPPYDPEQAGTVPAQGEGVNAARAGDNGVPGAGVLALAAVGALAALALRRR